MEENVGPDRAAAGQRLEDGQRLDEPTRLYQRPRLLQGGAERGRRGCLASTPGGHGKRQARGGSERAKKGERLQIDSRKGRRRTEKKGGRTRAGLADVRLHDLRHSFASRALALGENLPMIARLLGHARIQTTARYAHLARDAVREAAVRVAEDIGDDILPARMPGCDLLPPKPRADASGGVALKESAARIAACIGEDVLPCRMAGSGQARTR